MTHAELRALVESIDSKNAEYILADYQVQQAFDSLNRWQNKDRSVSFILDEDEDEDARYKRIMESVREDLERRIREFDAKHLTPANAKVGEGATVVFWSDRHAGTIVKVTKASITIQRDKATLDPNFKPEWIVGGFAGHCTNQDEQSYSYERDENGQTYTIRWSKKYNRYGQPDNIRAIKGRYEFYDYNF